MAGRCYYCHGVSDRREVRSLHADTVSSFLHHPVLDPGDYTGAHLDSLAFLHPVSIAPHAAFGLPWLCWWVLVSGPSAAHRLTRAARSPQCLLKAPLGSEQQCCGVRVVKQEGILRRIPAGSSPIKPLVLWSGCDHPAHAAAAAGEQVGP